MKVIIVLILVLMSFNVKSQDYTMFWNSKSLFNPSTSGLNNKIFAGVIGKKYWFGLKDSPFDGTVIFDMKLNAFNSGIGVNYNYESFGLIKSKNINTNYNYQIVFKNQHILSIGISGGLTIAKFDFSLLILPSSQDHIIGDINKEATYLNYKFGISYLTNHWEFGLSSTQSKYLDHVNSNVNGMSQYWAFSSYLFDIGDNIDIKPNVLLKSMEFNKNNITLSSGLMMIYKEQFWTGISYTINHSYGAMVGYDVMRMIRIGYSLDFSTSAINNYSQGNHEIILSFILK